MTPSVTRLLDAIDTLAPRDRHARLDGFAWAGGQLDLLLAASDEDAVTAVSERTWLWPRALLYARSYHPDSRLERLTLWFHGGIARLLDLDRAAEALPLLEALGRHHSRETIPLLRRCTHHPALLSRASSLLPVLLQRASGLLRELDPIDLELLLDDGLASDDMLEVLSGHADGAVRRRLFDRLWPLLQDGASHLPWRGVTPAGLFEALVRTAPVPDLLASLLDTLTHKGWSRALVTALTERPDPHLVPALERWSDANPARVTQQLVRPALEACRRAPPWPD